MLKQKEYRATTLPLCLTSKLQMFVAKDVRESPANP